MREVLTPVWQTPVLINSFSLAILFVFFLNHHKKNQHSRSQKYQFFQHMVLTNIILLVLDSITFLVLEAPQPGMRTINVLVTMAYFMVTPLMSFFFIRFVDEVICLPADMTPKRTRLYLIPVALHVILAVATPFTGWFFRIDALNAYHRGSLLPLSFFLSYLLMVLAFIKAFRYYARSRKENKGFAKHAREYSWLIKFTLIPLVGGVVQAFFYNVTYVWNFTVIALLVLYINYQNEEITTDSLTGLYNRRQAFAFFERFVRERGKESIALIMMDINNFKSINDRYGHSMGDEAIITVARCLEAEFGWDDFICRFGGDEYVVITKHGAPAHLKAALQRVNDSLEARHREKQYPFELSLSAGYALYSKKNDTMDALFQKADAMMFEQKAKLMRRSSDKHA